MKRNQILVTLCVVFAVAIILVARKNLKPAPRGGAQVVITTGGQVTVVPTADRWKATIVAEFPKTNPPPAPPPNK